MYIYPTDTDTGAARDTLVVLVSKLFIFIFQFSVGFFGYVNLYVLQNATCILYLTVEHGEHL
ncbi:hypothetical protein M5D96_004131 [Drosophila gunungcola]|uniref:Uncharacterized protein n=1 Tax=Drosophila gunungcola TaxID=103775 RepID=A0A9P9YTW9_9MUSC|nr:hypothetical protein M5D96_004131 [Drosophila gunungcola]